jgi:hypothetical protein
MAVPLGKIDVDVFNHVPMLVFDHFTVARRLTAAVDQLENRVPLLRRLKERRTLFYLFELSGNWKKSDL